MHQNEGKLHFFEFAFTKATIWYMTAMIANRICWHVSDNILSTQDSSDYDDVQTMF